MNFLPLHTRRSVAELMDDPALDPAAHHLALEGLQRLNRASKAADHIFQPILAFARQHHLSHLSLLDVACGGGDVPLRLYQLAQSAGLTLRLTLTDRSPTALQTAQQAAAAANIPVTTFEGEVPNNLPKGRYDIVTNSLFLHHLTAHQTVDALAAMAARTQKLLVISDLRRSLPGYLITLAATRLLSRSPIVHYDGPVSVQAAWTPSELRNFAALAQLPTAHIRNIFPWRMLLTWSP